MNRHSRSTELHERATRSLAGGVSSEFRRHGHPRPLVYVSARGSRIHDADENEYLDFTLSQGPLILGHSHPEVLERVGRAMEAGQLFAGQHLQEIELAERFQEWVPCAELVRFSLTGSEAVHAALRAARAVTGRPRFIRFEGHYHGWFDNVAFGLSGAAPEEIGERERPLARPWSAGLPPGARDEFILLPWNDLGLVERALAEHGAEVAAVLTEAHMCNHGCIAPEPGFLEGLRRLCDRHGAALIFDEVITGFRLGMGGAQAHYGVTPDLATFAKAMANGFPISAVAGRRRWMQPFADGRAIHAGTANSGNVSVAAALATLEVLERDRVHERLFALGARLMDGLRAAARETGQPLRVQGPGPMFHAGFTRLAQVRDYRDTLAYDQDRLAAFTQGMHERGLRLIGRGLWYLSAAHTEAEVDQAVEAARAVLGGLVDEGREAVSE